MGIPVIFHEMSIVCPTTEAIREQSMKFFLNIDDTLFNILALRSLSIRLTII